MRNPAPMTEMARITAASASEVCRGYKPAPEALALLTEGVEPAGFVEVLAGAGLDAEARRFLAQALPKRESVWWAVLALDEFAPPAVAAQAEVLDAARRWVADPTDANRRDAWAVAQAGELDNPAGLVALAVFFGGDSLAPLDLPPIAPAGYLTGDAVATALTLATVMNEPRRAPERSNALLRLGLAIASGEVPFPAPDAPE